MYWQLLLCQRFCLYMNVLYVKRRFVFLIAHLRILGKGLRWFQENSTFKLFCSYSDANTNVEPARLRFYDGKNKQMSEDRGFRRTVLSSSSSFVNVSLTKDRIQAEDFGTYVCRYGNDSSFNIHVGILKGIFQSHRKWRIIPLEIKKNDKWKIFIKNCTHCFSYWYMYVLLYIFGLLHNKLRRS